MVQLCTAVPLDSLDCDVNTFSLSKKTVRVTFSGTLWWRHKTLTQNEILDTKQQILENKTKENTQTLHFMFLHFYTVII